MTSGTFELGVVAGGGSGAGGVAVVVVDVVVDDVVLLGGGGACCASAGMPGAINAIDSDSAAKQATSSAAGRRRANTDERDAIHARIRPIASLPGPSHKTRMTDQQCSSRIEVEGPPRDRAADKPDSPAPCE